MMRREGQQAQPQLPSTRHLLHLKQLQEDQMAGIGDVAHAIIPCVDVDGD